MTWPGRCGSEARSWSESALTRLTLLPEDGRATPAIRPSVTRPCASPGGRVQGVRYPSVTDPTPRDPGRSGPGRPPIRSVRHPAITIRPPRTRPCANPGGRVPGIRYPSVTDPTPRDLRRSGPPHPLTDRHEPDPHAIPPGPVQGVRPYGASEYRRPQPHRRPAHPPHRRPRRLVPVGDNCGRWFQRLRLNRVTAGSRPPDQV